MFMIGDAATTRRLMVVLLLLAVLGVAGQIQQQLRPSASAPPSHTGIVAPTPAITFVAPTYAPTSAGVTNLAPYPIYGPAAELHDTVWLNTPAPIKLADLRGKVVLLLFWAFDCLPCMPVLANVREWNAAYASQGLTVIGIHYPKVDEERSYDNLVAALTRLNIGYPVAQDNDGLTWHAYGASVWPSISLVDKRGLLRYQQVGAGGYDDLEKAIRALLAEDT